MDEEELPDPLTGPMYEPVKTAEEIIDTNDPTEFEWDVPTDWSLVKPEKNPYDDNNAQLSPGGNMGMTWDEPFMQQWYFSEAIDLYGSQMEYRNRNFGATFEQEGYAPSALDIQKVADKHGLPEVTFENLAQARSPDDLEVRGDAYAKRMDREKRVAQNMQGPIGFLGSLAIAASDPAGLILTAGVDKLLAPIKVTTRFGSAVKAAATTGAAMAPLEYLKVQNDPFYTSEDAAFALLGSTILSAGLGSLSKGGDGRKLERLDEVLAAEAEARPGFQRAPGSGSSGGAAQASPVLNEPAPVDVPDGAPEQAGFGAWGTPILRLSRAEDPDVRMLASQMAWNPGSGTTQPLDGIGAARRIYESGGVYLRQARQAAHAWAKQQGRMSKWNPLAAPDDDTIGEFMDIVSQVHAGVRESSDPHVMKAVRSLQDGYEDSLKYVQNSSYNGPGSEGVAGLSMDEFAGIETDPRYVMRRFSAPGWRRTVGTLGEAGVEKRLTDVIWRTEKNRAYFLERARKKLGLLDDEALAKAAGDEPAPGTAAPAPEAVPAPDPDAPASQVAPRDLSKDEKAFFQNEINAAKTETAPAAPAAASDVYTPDEMFGGKPPKARNAVASDFYNALLKGKKSFDDFLALVTNPEDVDPKTLKAGLRELYELEGIEKGIPKDPADVAKRLRSLYKTMTGAADEARAKAPAAEPPKDVQSNAAKFAEWRKAQAAPEAPPPVEARVDPPAVAAKPADGLLPERRSPADAQVLELEAQQMAYRIARTVAAKYARTVAKLMNPAAKEVHAHAPVSPEFRAAAKELIKDEFNDGADFADNVEEALETILDLLAPARKSAIESNRAKSRLALDLKAGQDDDILGMFDWNAEALFSTYRRHVAGRAGVLKMGFTRVQEIDAKIAAIRTRAENAPEQMQKNLEKEANLLDLLKGAMLGTPPPWVKEASEDWIWAVSQVKRYNFSNLMNNVGFLSMAEVMGAMTAMGPLRLLKSIPAYSKYIKAVRAGDPAALNSIYYVSDAIMGHGTGQVRARLHGFSDVIGDGFSPYIDRKTAGVRDVINTFTRKSANATARMSGMAPIAEWMRSAVTGADAQNFVTASRKGKMPYSPRRMKALGIDGPMWTRIDAELKRMEDLTSPDTGQKRPFLDLNAWEDGEALNVFLNAIDRNSRRLIMEGDPGNKPFWMDRPAPSLLFQFLNFPMNAYSKHLRFAGGVRDGRALAEATAMALGGGMGHIARVAAIGYLTKAVGDERDEYLNKMLSEAEIAKGLVYYSAHGSLLPNIWDLGVTGAQGMGAFDFEGGEDVKAAMTFSKSRASGLPGDPVTGNATYSRMNQMLNTTGDMINKGPDRDDVKAFAKAWLPMGNHIAMSMAVNAIADFLPEDTGED